MQTGIFARPALRDICQKPFERHPERRCEGPAEPRHRDVVAGPSQAWIVGLAVEREAIAMPGAKPVDDETRARSEDSASAPEPRRSEQASLLQLVQQRSN